MSFRNYIARHDFISEPLRRLLHVMSDSGIDFRATSEISSLEIITVTRPRINVREVGRRPSNVCVCVRVFVETTYPFIWEMPKREKQRRY